MGLFFGFGGVPGEPLPSIADYPNPLRATQNKEEVRPATTSSLNVGMA
jgi:hypothetical protein